MGKKFSGSLACPRLKKNMNKQNESRLILFLLRNFNTRHCPTNHLLMVNEKKLETLAIENKCMPCLFHLSECQNCQRYFSVQFIRRIKKYYSQSIQQSLLYQQQSNQITLEFQKNKLPFCFLKDFRSYRKITHQAKYFWGSDVDMLVAPENFSRAEKILGKLKYRKIKTHQYETAFKKTGELEVDLHSLPTDFSRNFQLLSLHDLQQLSALILANAGSKNGQTTKETFLLFLIIHFWVNDCLKRIRPLYDLAVFIKQYQREIDWSKFLSMATELHFLQQAVFVMYLCNKQFATPIPRDLQSAQKKFCLCSISAVSQ